MANEFYYNIQISILHPTMNARLFETIFEELGAIFVSQSGELVMNKDGIPIIPNRIATKSQIIMRVQDSDKLDSKVQDLQLYLEDLYDRIVPYEYHLRELAQVGTIELIISIFRQASSSAFLLTSDILSKFSLLNFDFEFNYYNL